MVQTKNITRRSSRRQAAMLPSSAELYHIEGIDVGGSVITLRLERRRTLKTGKFNATEVKPHVQVILLKGSRIVRLISVISPDEK